ncbi:MAG: hypothetical protein AB7F64_00195 [Gammaproteobacteria bacterium]
MARETEIQFIENHLNTFSYEKAHKLLVQMINTLAHSTENEPESFLQAVEKLAVRVKPEIQVSTFLIQCLQRLRGQFYAIDQSVLTQFSEQLFDVWQPGMSERELRAQYEGECEFVGEGAISAKRDFMLRMIARSLNSHYYDVINAERNKKKSNLDLPRNLREIKDGRNVSVFENKTALSIPYELKRLIPHNALLREAIYQFLNQESWTWLPKTPIIYLDNFFNTQEYTKTFEICSNSLMDSTVTVQEDGSILDILDNQSSRREASKKTVYENVSFKFRLRISETKDSFLDDCKHKKFVNRSARHFGNVRCEIAQYDMRVPDAEFRDKYLKNFLPELVRKASVNLPFYLHEKRAIEMCIAPYLYCDENSRISLQTHKLEDVSKLTFGSALENTDNPEEILKELIFVIASYNVAYAAQIFSTPKLFDKLSFKQLALLAGKPQIKILVNEKVPNFHEQLLVNLNNGTLKIHEILEVADLPQDVVLQLFKSALNNAEQCKQLLNICLDKEFFSSNKVNNISKLFLSTKDPAVLSFLEKVEEHILIQDNQYSRKSFIQLMALIPGLRNYFFDESLALHYFFMDASDLAELILVLSDADIMEMGFFSSSKGNKYYQKWLSQPKTLAKVFQCTEVTPGSFAQLLTTDQNFRAALLQGINFLDQDSMEQVFIYKFSELKPYLSEFKYYAQLAWFERMLNNNEVPNMSSSFYILLTLIKKSLLPEVFKKSDKFLVTLFLKMLTYSNEQNIFNIFINNLEKSQLSRLLPELVKDEHFIEALLDDEEPELISSAKIIPDFWATLLTISDERFLSYTLLIAIKQGFLSELFNQADAYLLTLFLKMLAYDNEQNTLNLFINNLSTEQLSRLLPELVKDKKFVEKLLNDGKPELISKAETISNFWATLLKIPAKDLPFDFIEKFIKHIVHKFSNNSPLLVYEKNAIDEILMPYFENNDSDDLDIDKLKDISSDFLYVFAYHDEAYANQILKSDALLKKLSYKQICSLYSKYPRNGFFQFGTNGHNVHNKNIWGIILLYFNYKNQITSDELDYIAETTSVVARKVETHGKFTSKEPLDISKLIQWNQLCLRIQKLNVTNTHESNRKQVICNRFYQMLETMISNGTMTINFLLQIPNFPVERLERIYTICLLKSNQLERLRKMILGLQPLEGAQIENVSKIFSDPTKPENYNFMNDIIQYMFSADTEQRRRFIQVLGKAYVFMPYIFRNPGYTEAAVYAVGYRSNQALIFTNISEIADLLLALPANYILSNQFFQKRTTFSHFSGRFDYLAMWIAHPKDLARVFLDSDKTPIVLTQAINGNDELRGALFEGIRQYGTRAEPVLTRKLNELSMYHFEFPDNSNLQSVAIRMNILQTSNI